jgi:iron complex transport system ATP-binding protein
MHKTGQRTVSFSGEGAAAFWTKRALLRNGYLVISSNSDVEIELHEHTDGPTWRIRKGTDVDVCDSIQGMIERLSGD